MRAYKAAFEDASIPLEFWVSRLVGVCTDGANVMTGAKAGVVALLCALQQEVTGEAYFVAMHANCHRADLVLKDALKEAHVFLDVLDDGLQHVAAYYNSAPARLKCFKGVAVTKFGKLETKRWAAFAGHPKHRLDPAEGLEAWIEEDPEALESWLRGIKQ